MMQMNTNGNRPPGKVGPPFWKTGLSIGDGSVGLATNTAAMSRTMAPILRKLER